ncbi:MAG: response regulator [Alphaproteobacteria bacterium]
MKKLGSGRQVLLVEDDALVRVTAVEMLEMAGHRVLEASSAAAALREIQSDRHIDVLVTDLRLPGMSGEELVAAALKLRPGLRVIIASGKDPENLQGIGDNVVFLPKPFPWEQLLGIVAS